MKNLKAYLLTLALLFLQTAVHAQVSQKTAENPAIADFKLNSKLMGREMPYRVILPKNYAADKRQRFPVIYLLHGFTGGYKNWTESTRLAEYAADYDYLIVTVEGGNGWYTDSATVPNDKYESYLVKELIPEIDGKFRTLGERTGRAIGGLSMGGFGAMKFGVKYPQMFVLAGSFSGAVDIASYRSSDEVTKNEFFRKSILGTFGEGGSETHKVNDLYRLFRELPAEKIGELPFFYVDCGIEDEFNLLKHNQTFADILLERKIPHEFRRLPGKHDWKFWDNSVREFLQVAEKFIKNPVDKK